MDFDDSLYEPLCNAIRLGDAAAVRSLVGLNPWLVDTAAYDNQWLSKANGNLNLVSTLLELGFDARELSPSKPYQGVLRSDEFASPEVARLLLAAGADPNWKRPMSSALSDRVDAVHFHDNLATLVEYGCDINMLFRWFDDPDRTMSLLDSVAESNPKWKIIRDMGGLSSKEIMTRGPQSPFQWFSSLPATEYGGLPNEFFPCGNLGRQTIAHYKNVRPKGLIETFSTEPPVFVRVSEPSPERDSLLLFTIGISYYPQEVDEDHLDYRFSELYLELPRDWQIDKVDDPVWNWPVDLLLRLSKIPVRKEGSFLGPVTIISSGPQREPFFPDLPYTAAMLFAEDSYERKSGHPCQLFRVVPLFEEERELTLSHSVPELLRRLDALENANILRPDRMNVGRSPARDE